LGGPRRGDRWALAVALLSTFAAGVIIEAPLRAPILPHRLPQGSDVFGPLPRVLAAVASAGGALVGLRGAAWSAWRLSKGRRAGAAAVAILALFAGLAAPAPAYAASADESLLLTLTNTVRATVGVPGLALDATLSNIARQWAGVMASQNNISHNANFKAQLEA